MKRLSFISKETGIPCSEDFNRDVELLFDEHPVLYEMFRMDMEISEFLVKEILSGNIKDWDDREEIASYMETHWNNPLYAERIAHAIRFLRQNAPMA